MKRLYKYVIINLLFLIFPFTGYAQDHLLIREICVSPSNSEYIAIYNTLSSTVDLSNYYISDNNTYYLVVNGTQSIGASDFLLNFPAGATITSGETILFAFDGTKFYTSFGFYPDYELGTSTGASATVPDMRMPAAGAGLYSGLTDSGEMLILFYWDGVSNLVKDVDYVAYGSTPTNFVDKTGISINGSIYASDISVASQSPIGAPSSEYAILRSSLSGEVTETSTGGNGITGHNETSEIFSSVFTNNTLANPSLLTSIYDCNPTTSPKSIELRHNYPNPFNNTTTISFSLSSKSFISLKIFDFAGREIVTLISEALVAGEHLQYWDASNMPNGMYFCQLKAGMFTETKKIILFR